MTSQMTLEVTVVSGEKVRLRGGRALGGGAYAVVHTASSAARTHVDKDGDCNGYPYWGEAVQVTMPSSSLGLDVEICRTRSSGRVMSVAAARVPAEDFMVGPLGHLHCLSYRLFDAQSPTDEPNRNGIVNITVKRLDGQGKAPAPPGEGKATVPAAGKAVDASASGSSGSCCGVAEGKPAAAAPAGAVMGYPVFSGIGHAIGKGYV